MGDFDKLDDELWPLLDLFEFSPGSFTAVLLRDHQEQWGGLQKWPLFHPPELRGTKTPFSRGKDVKGIVKG